MTDECPISLTVNFGYKTTKSALYYDIYALGEKIRCLIDTFKDFEMLIIYVLNRCMVTQWLGAISRDFDRIKNTHKKSNNFHKRKLMNFSKFEQFNVNNVG